MGIVAVQIAFLQRTITLATGDLPGCHYVVAGLCQQLETTICTDGFRFDAQPFKGFVFRFIKCQIGVIQRFALVGDPAFEAGGAPNVCR